MTTTSDRSSEPPVLGGTTEPAPLVRGTMRRLLAWIIPANISLFLINGAVPGVLLPLQLEQLDSSGKVASFALVSTIGAVVAMIAQPVAGLVSDRTRSRFGKRAQWILGGAIVAGLALVGMGSANGIVQVTISYVILQLAINFMQAPLSAILPDRVPRGARGTFSALAGLGALVGASAGQVVGATFARSVGTGYVIFAGLVVVVLALFLVFNPDHASKDADREPFSVSLFLHTFWINPVRHPDFFWAFTGRLLLYTGYFGVLGYQLYILQDYIGLGADAAAAVPVAGLLNLAGIIVSTAVCGPISDRFGGRRKPFVFASSLIVAIALVIPMVSHTYGAWLLLSAIAGVGFGAFSAVDQALMADVLPSASSYAKDLGVVNIAATLPQVIAPAVAGAVILLFGGYLALFPIGIVLSVLGAFAVWFIKGVR
ncbi:MFS transporter [Curtobacterium sp. MCPF17_031]|uniref:MFS transporter n=1 Tax=Curtobacterium sp. MCPF17_031 TaxID=2175653 RepID=UPI000DA9FEF3|nr:MFS transporter [Curtobacterium sp. MCPF17_031]PZE37128.1 MFS transporter [Curtobacterium sp. MCPF17_031]